MIRTVLVHYHSDKIEADVFATDGGFELRWSDYVANEWSETYNDLPVAVARLAVLIDAVESDAFLHLDAPEFAREARRWLDHMA